MLSPKVGSQARMSTANTFNILVSTLRPEKLIRGIYIGKRAKKTDFIHR